MKANRYPYYSGSGLGLTEHDACSGSNPPAYCSDGTSWWDNWGSTIIGIIGTSITKIGDRYQTIIDNEAMKKSIAAATGGGAGAPTTTQQNTMAQMLANQTGMSLTEAQAKISELLGNGIKKETSYPSWLLPAGIGLVLIVLLRGQGGGR